MLLEAAGTGESPPPSGAPHGRAPPPEEHTHLSARPRRLMAALALAAVGSLALGTAPAAAVSAGKPVTDFPIRA